MNYNLASRLFKIVNDEPIYSPVLFSLDCYKKLYMQDKSELKSNFAKHLLYIYYSCDPKSPYFEIENKEEECMKMIYGRVKKSMNKTMNDCIKDYIKCQSTPSIRAYERIMKICDSTGAELQRNVESTKELNLLIKDIDDACKDLKKDGIDGLEVRLELQERKIELERKFVEKQKAMADLTTKIEKQVESLLKLKKDVEKERLMLDSEDNKDNIARFVIDELINKYNE